MHAAEQSSNENTTANMNASSTGLTSVTETSNMVSIAEKKCTSRKWQENQYTCHHAVTDFHL